MGCLTLRRECRLIVLALIGLFAGSDATAQVFSDRWGSLGSGPGQFNFPVGIATDRDGFVYVTDELNHRVQKFDRAGTFVLQWGGYGTGDGQFNDPVGIAVDHYGRVYVNDARATQSTLRDSDRDGDLDLELVFRTNDTGLACGQTSATLTARTVEGVRIAGTDRIRPVACK